MVREQIPDSASQKLVNGHVSANSVSESHTGSGNSAREPQVASNVPNGMVIPRYYVRRQSLAQADKECGEGDQ
jgi:hypothetical protein